MTTTGEHWAIENAQHWVLDVQLGEDDTRACKHHSDSNLTLIRRTSLNLLRRNDSSSLNIRRRRMRACSTLDYRHRLIFGAAAV